MVGGRAVVPCCQLLVDRHPSPPAAGRATWQPPTAPACVSGLGCMQPAMPSPLDRAGVLPFLEGWRGGQRAVPSPAVPTATCTQAARGTTSPAPCAWPASRTTPASACSAPATHATPASGRGMLLPMGPARRWEWGIGLGNCRLRQELGCWAVGLPFPATWPHHPELPLHATAGARTHSARTSTASARASPAAAPRATWGLAFWTDVACLAQTPHVRGQSLL